MADFFGYSRKTLVKYIVTIDENDREELFTFPRMVHHDAMAEMLGLIKNQTHGNWHRVRRMPVAAGFVNADNQCYGASETLGLIARPALDSDLLRKQLD